jgi:hypothetical protein
MAQIYSITGSWQNSCMRMYWLVGNRNSLNPKARYPGCLRPESSS